MQVHDPKWGDGWICDGCGATWFRFDTCMVCALSALTAMSTEDIRERVGGVTWQSKSGPL